ncbi:glycosyltransferase [Terrabacter sp. GCM10028922]|uniref:glycosyltransferase n=1 Tax=Terrabacter sp. GCM10028922 TaxID=3273428 RepID=UPI00361A0D89
MTPTALAAPRLSVVIPTFNVASKIGRCLASLTQVGLDESELEVVFVDDASQDETVSILERACSEHPGWTLAHMPANSGSPSAPRNLGLSLATGTYVCFMDADDEFLPGAVTHYLLHAERSSLDLLRGALLVDRGTHAPTLTNHLTPFAPTTPVAARIAAIIRGTSTTVPGLIRRSLLESNGVRWDADLRMGEDTVFLVSVMRQAARIDHLEEPLFIYRNAVDFGASSTQKYGRRELDNHLRVWTQVSAALSELGIDYMALRGQVALQAVLTSLHRFHDGTLDQATFIRFSEFLHEHSDVVRSYDLAARLKSSLEIALSGDYAAFMEAIKPRLLIGGYDLKFIQGAYEALSRHFQVKVDAWKGHEVHDVNASTQLLRWADVVLAEWLLGNAVWYSKNKRREQRLVVRTHRFELTRDYGNQVAHGRVDRFFGVSVPTAEQILRTFPGITRRQLRIIPNFIDTHSYERTTNPERVFNLAMVGILPSLKGYRRALDLLKTLREVDDRYTLTTFGKRPEDLPWVLSDPMNAAYYSDCSEFIQEHGLEEATRHEGWVSTRQVLKDYGFVLSLSDFESFHVAPGEAFAAGNVGLFLPWDGVEYIYPSTYVLPDIPAMAEQILALRSISAFDSYREEGARFVEQEYGIDAFVEQFTEMIRAI